MKKKTVGRIISESIWNADYYLLLGVLDIENSDEEDGLAKKYRTGSQAENLSIAELFQSQRTDKGQVFQSLLDRLIYQHKNDNDNRPFEDLESWFDKHPIDVDEIRACSEQSIGLKIEALLEVNQTLGLKVAQLVQKKRSQKTAILEYLGRQWEYNNKAFDDLKKWFIDNPTDIDKVKLFTRDNSIEYTLGKLINDVLKDKNSRMQAIELAGLAQHTRTNKASVLNYLFDIWLQDDSMFEELKLWFEQNFVSDNGIIMIPREFIQQKLDHLMLQNKAKAIKFISEVSKYRYAEESLTD